MELSGASGGACCAAEADGRMWVTKIVTMANEIRYHWKLTEYMNVVGKHVRREREMLMTMNRVSSALWSSGDADGEDNEVAILVAKC